MSSKATLFLIDGSSQMYRAYHAIRGLSGPDGKSTNAVYGFMTMLRKLLTDHQPAYIAASFDLPGPTFRDQMVSRLQGEPRGHARRPRGADSVGPRGLRGARRAGHHAEGFEADDVIATLARCAVQEGYDVAIVTGDKDFFQLVDDRIRVFNPRDEGTWYDADGVREKWGVGPEQVVDVLALMGDAVDNIKGVPGIGEKGAKDLDCHVGQPRRAARARRARCRRRNIARRSSPMPTTRARAASCCASAPTSRAASKSMRSGSAAPRASGATRCSRASASAR